jgi:Carboxypeptidase regulatory-like domain/TonB dependent receptor
MTKISLSNSIKFLIFTVFCFALSAGQIFAQSTVTGGIRGSVTDAQSANVPNATVTVTNEGTNKSETTTTNADGNYRFSNLQPGTYTISVTSSGFSEFKQEKVVVEVGQATAINIPLGVAGTSATVDVTAEAPVINTNDNSNTININQTSINELPINGRRASNFVLLTPGVSPDGGFGLISFRGISGLLNNSTIDGGDNNQAFFSEERGRTRINYSISQDAVREFSVNTSNYSAEFGRSAGGVVNTVTKSGTNEFHGSAFYYLRDNRVGARNPFSFQTISTPSGNQVVGLKPKDQRHQFGGSVGGPIIKNKLFFFFSYDQQKRDFPAVAAPASLTFFNLTAANRTTLADRGVSDAQINSGISFLQSLTGEVARKGDQTLFLPKIDWVINDKHTFSAVYNRLRWNSPAGVQTQAVVSRGIASFGDDLVTLDTFNARLNSTFSPSVINEARFQYSRDLEQQLAQAPAPNEPVSANGTVPSVAIGGGGITFGQPDFLNRSAYPDERRTQIANTTTVIKGRHTLKFGGDFNYVSDLLDNLFQNAGAYSYNNLVDFLTDRAVVRGCRTAANVPVQCYATYNQGFGPTAFKFATQDYNAFFQDDFRLDPRLTLNFGLRYEYERLPDPQIPNPLEPRSSNFPNNTTNFGPRFGFALDVTGKGDTSIRAGYGIYYGRIINSTISNAITNTGVAAGQRQVSQSPTAANTALLPVYPGVLAAPPTATGAAGDIIVFAPDFQNPLIHQMDVIFERTIAQNTVVSVSGLLSIGDRLPTFVDTNLNRPTGTVAYNVVGGPFAGQTIRAPLFTGARPNTNFSRITEIRSTIDSQYFGLVFQANRRLTKGLQFQASYTLSKATDNGQTSQTFTSPNVPLNPYDIDIERGTSNLDIPHRFVASAVYNPSTLFGLGKNSNFGRAIFGGFTFSPIVTIQSGRPYSAGTSGNVSGGTSQGIIGAGGAGRLPNLDRNTFRLPYVFNVDARLSRRFRLGETANLELLAEGFNIFNRQNVTNLGTRAYVVSTVGGAPTLTYDPTFGIPTEAGNSIFRERQIQFAARFQF